MPGSIHHSDVEPPATNKLRWRHFLTGNFWQLDRPPTADQAKDQHDQGQEQQQVDKCTTDMHHQETQEP